MEAWSWRFLALLGPVARVSLENRSVPERTGCLLHVSVAGLQFDLGDDLGDMVLDGLGREVLPARQGSQFELVVLGELFALHRLALSACLVLSGAVEPDARDRLSLTQGFRAVSTGPVVGFGDQVFFAAVAENVA